jgi:hypothetical protein
VRVRFGDYLPLSRVLEDGNATKYVTASVYDSNGNIVPGSPAVLEYVDEGLYINTVEIKMPASLNVFAVYRVFDSPGNASPSYIQTRDVFQLETAAIEEISGLIEDPSELVGMVEETQCQ